MLTVRAMSDGSTYRANHLEQKDYYAEGERVVGEWFGNGAARLGLIGVVAPSQFEAMRQGVHPQTGEKLRPRVSANRADLNGVKQSEGRTLYDFTISAPKSVSMMAGPGGDSRLIAAHDHAVKQALLETERWASTRIRRSAQNADRVTGNVVVALYGHDASRELDPQLHTHAVTGNLTFDQHENRWKALQAGPIYERRAYLTAVYRAVLRQELAKLGYETENQMRGSRYLGFEIKGLSKELLEKFSRRSKQRDEAIAAFTEKNGRAPTDNETAVLVRETRAPKLIKISTEEVKQQQRDRLTIAEAEQLSRVKAEAEKTNGRKQGQLKEHHLDGTVRISLEHALNHSLERVSVIPDYEVLTEALNFGAGSVSVETLKAEMVSRENKGDLIRAGHRIATNESLERERKTIELVNCDAGKLEPLGREKGVKLSDQLNPEQREAVRFILNSRDRAVNLQGAAGTGKTATLGELKRGLQESGRMLFAVAPTASAVDELKKVGFKNAVTIERLLEDREQHLHLPNRAVVVDEAGMISGRQMHALLGLAHQHNARLIFSGDTSQIQSVEASDALRILEKESSLSTVRLQQVQRQQKVNYKNAIETLRKSAGRGFDKLDRLGAVNEVGVLDRPRAVAAAYRDAHGEKLIVCPSHDEIGRVTAAIRTDRRERGELAHGRMLDRFESLQFTEARKRDFRSLQAGQILVFHRETKVAAKGEALTVLRGEADRIIASDAKGKEITLTKKQAASFGVFERRAIEVAKGDPLLIQANTRDEAFRFSNGEIVKVKRVNEQGRIHLEDGRTLPKGFAQFNYGYAVTAHKSQGKTVDEVIVSGDYMKKELFYVAASRGRHRLQIFTGDKESLRSSIGITAERMSALELERQAARTVNRSRTAPRPRTMASMIGNFLETAWENIPNLLLGLPFKPRDPLERSR